MSRRWHQRWQAADWLISIPAETKVKPFGVFGLGERLIENAKWPVVHCLSSASVSLVFLVLYICVCYIFLLLSLYLSVSWAWWDWPSTWWTNYHPSVLWHCSLGHLTCKIVSEMTYNVSSGSVEVDLGPLNFGLTTAWRKATTQDEWRHIVDTAVLQWSTLWKKKKEGTLSHTLSTSAYNAGSQVSLDLLCANIMA